MAVTIIIVSLLTSIGVNHYILFCYKMYKKRENEKITKIKKWICSRR